MKKKLLVGLSLSIVFGALLVAFLFQHVGRQTAKQRSPEQVLAHQFDQKSSVEYMKRIRERFRIKNTLQSKFILLLRQREETTDPVKKQELQAEIDQVQAEIKNFKPPARPTRSELGFK